MNRLGGKVMGARLLLILMGGAILAAALLAGRQIAEAAPALQLPWPSGQQHRINGGNTYGCDTHNQLTASSSTSYNADYYAIDFQFAQGQDVSAVAAGNVAVRGDAGGGSASG